jgi:hypothetical protein
MPMIRLTTIIVASKVVSLALIVMRALLARDYSIQARRQYKALCRFPDLPLSTDGDLRGEFPRRLERDGRIRQD